MTVQDHPAGVLHNGAESQIDWTGGVAFPQPALQENFLGKATDGTTFNDASIVEVSETSVTWVSNSSGPTRGFNWPNLDPTKKVVSFKCKPYGPNPPAALFLEFGTQVACYIDLANGSLSSFGTNILHASSYPLEDGGFLVIVQGSVDLKSPAISFYLSEAAGSLSFDGGGNSGATVWEAMSYGSLSYPLDYASSGVADELDADWSAFDPSFNPHFQQLEIEGGQNKSLLKRVAYDSYLIGEDLKKVQTYLKPKLTGTNDPWTEYKGLVEAEGGSFDLSGGNSVYTESYVSDAHKQLFYGLMNDGLWPKITELYLLMAKTFGGIRVKAKGTGLLTNNGFIPSDYVVAGTGAGLKNNSAKYLSGTALFSSPSASYGYYFTEPYTGSGKRPMGCADVGFTNRSYSGDQGVDPTNGQAFLLATAGSLGGFDPRQKGLYVFSRESATRFTGYLNQVQIAQNIGTVTPVAPIHAPFIFAYSNAGSPAGWSDCRIATAFVGLGLTTAEVKSLTSRIDAFMSAFGQ